MRNQLRLAAHFISRNFHAPLTLIGVEYHIKAQDMMVRHFAFDGGASLTMTKVYRVVPNMAEPAHMTF